MDESGKNELLFQHLGINYKPASYIETGLIIFHGYGDQGFLRNFNRPEESNKVKNLIQVEEIQKKNDEGN